MSDSPDIAVDLAHAIDSAYAADVEAPRVHLGASVMGKQCMRAVWYEMRWAVVKKFGGRMLRLFGRGRDEEDRFIKALRKAGCDVVTVDQKTGQQIRHSRYGGHMGGARDGTARNVPGSVLSTKFLLEFKTHNRASFRKLTGAYKPKLVAGVATWPLGKGVRVAKPEHYAQMQLYMHWTQGEAEPLNTAIYGAVCKDNDHLYFEKVPYDAEYAANAEARGEAVVFAEETPPRAGRDASAFVCKMCKFSDLCHGKAFAEPNCRTCAHSTAEKTGNARWSCAYWKRDEIPHDFQPKGCQHHVYNPAFMLNHGDYIGGNSEMNYAEYRAPNGVIFRNGTKRAEPLVYSSAELPFAPRAPAPGEAELVRLFDGKYVAAAELTETDVAANQQAADYYARGSQKPVIPRAAAKGAR